MPDQTAIARLRLVATEETLLATQPLQELAAAHRGDAEIGSLIGEVVRLHSLFVADVDRIAKSDESTE